MVAGANPRCKVCRLLAGELAYVNARLLAGDSARSIARKLVGITRADVAKHHKLCPNSKDKEERGAKDESAEES